MSTSSKGVNAVIPPEFQKGLTGVVTYHVRICASTLTSVLSAIGGTNQSFLAAVWLKMGSPEDILNSQSGTNFAVRQKANPGLGRAHHLIINEKNGRIILILDLPYRPAGPWRVIYNGITLEVVS